MYSPMHHSSIIESEIDNIPAKKEKYIKHCQNQNIVKNQRARKKNSKRQRYIGLRRSINTQRK